MKALISMVLLTTLMTSCSHKKDMKKDYSPTVSYEQEEKKFSSTVLLPKEFKEKIPLVVIVHEWWGRTPYIMNRSKMLNEQGYATLAVDLFGDNKIVDTPKEAQALATPLYKNPETGIERLTKYIELAKKDPHIDSSKIYVIGFCFGGTQALNLARSGADIKGVVSFHGGLATTVPSKNVKAQILVLNGAADPMVPKKDITAFEKEMKASKAEYKLINYPNALHAFTNPMATEKGKKFKMPIAYNKKADEASWNELLKFLKK